MGLRCSEFPGRYERHLLRKRNNPLFPEAERTPTPEQLESAQKLDHEEIVAFIPRFRELVLRAATLQANEGSEVILALKQELDRCYEECCGLADEQQETKQAIRRLLAPIMAAVRKGAQDDPLALAELEQEEAARSAHFALCEQQLVADLLSPDSPIQPAELAATLLSASAEEVAAVVEILARDQLTELCRQGSQLLADCGAATPHTATERLQQLTAALQRLI